MSNICFLSITLLYTKSYCNPRPEYDIFLDVQKIIINPTINLASTNGYAVHVLVFYFSSLKRGPQLKTKSPDCGRFSQIHMPEEYSKDKPIQHICLYKYEDGSSLKQLLSANETVKLTQQKSEYNEEPQELYTCRSLTARDAGAYKQALQINYQKTC